MKNRKYYKLIPYTESGLNEYLFEFGNEKREPIEKRFKKAKANYILIEKHISDGDETYANLYPINNELDFTKKIKNNTCYDYSGIAIVVWDKGKCYSWETYKNSQQ